LGENAARVSVREERFERAAARAIGTVPEVVRRWIAGDAIARHDGVALDSRIAALVAVAARRGRAFDPRVTVEQMRRSYARLTRVCGIHEGGDVTVGELSIPTDDGMIGARLYRPARDAHLAHRAGDGQFAGSGSTAPEAVLPLLVFFHGGGFVIGDVPSYDGLARFFAVQGQLAIVSVEYRLGPEHPFPRGAEDGIAAFAWAVRNAGELGTDAARTAVGGDSAGGTVAAAISAVAASRGLPRPAYQYLIYPGVDRRGDYASRRMFERGVPFTPATMEWFAANYAAGLDVDSPLASPLLAPHPEQNPPTYLLAAGFDPLVDEGKAYAERLRAAGVDVTYDLRPSLSHAFVNLAGVVPEARRALRDGIRATASALRAAA
jgi:acetyl esterase